MTREELKKAMRDTKKEVVIKNLHKLLSLVEGYPEYEDCISYAIELLEQEPILDKIRAEIQENINYNKKMNYQGIVAGLLLTLDIIDKYKAESEVEEGNDD